MTRQERSEYNCGTGGVQSSAELTSLLIIERESRMLVTCQDTMRQASRVIRCRRLLLALFYLLSVSSVSAADFFWATPSTRFFEQNSSWSPSGIPSVGDRAIFDLMVTDPANRYGVHLTSNAIVDALLIRSDTTAILPRGNTLTLANDSIGLEVAQNSGELGNLSIINDSLNRRGTVRVVQDARVAVNSGSDGLLLITTDFEVGDTLTVGVEGSGYFQTSLQGQSTIEKNLVAGDEAGSEGVVFVGDAGTTLNITETFVLGESGEGTLTVREGATLNAREVVVGRLPGSDSSAFALEPGTSVEIQDTLTVGEQGMGLFQLINQASLNSSSVEVGAAVGGDGRVSLFDNGTALDTVGLSAGIHGKGVFQVTAGAAATATSVSLGMASGSDGNLLAVGVNSSMTVNGDADAGISGIGWLQAFEGGSISVDYMTLGIAPSGNGLLRVADPGSSVQISQDLMVGISGEARVQINAGAYGTIGGNMKMGVGLQATTSAILRDANSQLDVTGTLVVGEQGIAEFFVEDGAQLFSGPATIGSVATVGSFVQLKGTGSSWSVDGDLTIGADDEAGELESKLSLFEGATTTVSGTTTVRPTGVLNLQAGKFISNGLEVDGRLVVRGDVESQVAGTGSIEVNNVSFIGDPDSVDGFVFSGDIMVGQFGEILAGTGTGSLQTFSANLIIEDADRAVIEGGIFTLVDGGIIDASNGLTLLPGAELRIQGGPSVVFLPELLDEIGNGTIYGPLTNDGTVKGPQNANQRLELGGDVDGSGDFTGWISMLSNVKPGNGVGTMTFENLDLEATSKVSFEISGASPSAFDVLMASGQVMLEGTAEVSLIDPNGSRFTPASGDSFELITADALLGSFSEWLLPNLDGNLNWEIVQTANTLTLLVVDPLLETANFDQDGSVDGNDFLIWQQNFESGATLAEGDANGDTLINNADYEIWMTQYGGSSPSEGSTATAPESNTLFLAIAALCTAMCCRCQKAAF